ncbi:hypothetical protein SAMN03080606_00194 [Alkaliphilus peptidifermentans DSM 18978]|uniref:Uncharacterized protein n=1 Tax=Alkaliphilus peptidifermentans DSM 18978 TaxID=1120976 RepID=A0A1G5ALU5_9FIRM|nr:hypothetical protein SAMN03080606_00194 [Alkaliphilus peptidifermentans DSM 18978]
MVGRKAKGPNRKNGSLATEGKVFVFEKLNCISVKVSVNFSPIKANQLKGWDAKLKGLIERMAAWPPKGEFLFLKN